MRPRRRRRRLRRQVTVDLQLASVFAVDERAQTFSADVTIVTAWTDPRLRSPDTPAVMDYDPSVLDDGRIWSPRLVFANLRDAVVRAEGVVRVHGSGRVVAVERFVGAFTAALDARDFPFDTQTLEWRLRSTRYAHEMVRLVAATEAEQANASAALAEVCPPPSGAAVDRGEVGGGIHHIFSED